jgi:hypothetical protein
MRQFLLPLVAFVFIGCAPLIVGPYSGSVTQQDAEQLQKLVIATPKIHFKKVLYIHAIRSDRVYVEAADSTLGSLIRCHFIARRRAGTWIIDEHSISNYDEVMVTE